MIRNAIIFPLFLFVIILGGCAGMNTYFGAPNNNNSPAAAPEPARGGSQTQNSPVKFSENPNLLVTSNRQYKRMTKARLEEESDLNSQAGSMWVMDGQGAYLFAQNKVRKEGDILNIKIEGAAQKEIETKVTVIKKLLQQLEDQENAEKAARLAAADPVGAEKKAPERAPASKAEDKPEAKKEEPVNIDSVPSRIIEKLGDGNYRIKGQHPFMIGKREYKVIVTGLVRAEDYNDEGVSSNKLLDAQYDVVSIRKKVGEVN